MYFHHDASVETGRHMDELIESAISSDRRDDEPDGAGEEDGADAKD